MFLNLALQAKDANELTYARNLSASGNEATMAGSKTSLSSILSRKPAECHIILPGDESIQSCATRFGLCHFAFYMRSSVV